jgi:hypothetical protein
MSNIDDDRYAREVIRVVADLTKRVEEHIKTGEEARKTLQANVEAIVVSMRQDITKTIVSLQLNQADHKVAHEADRVERATRQLAVDTKFDTRQSQVDLQLSQIRNWLIGGLVGIVAIGAFIVGWLVF